MNDQTVRVRGGRAHLPFPATGFIGMTAVAHEHHSHLPARTHPQMNQILHSPDGTDERRRSRNDDEVAYWYDNEKPSLGQAEEQARFIGRWWRYHGDRKWIAYDHVSGEIVGRGRIPCMPADDDWGQSFC